MPLFMTKPVQVEAVQWDSRTPGKLPDWARDHVTEGPTIALLDTFQGRRQIEPGDWVVRDSEGALSSVPKAVFGTIYETSDENKI